MTDKTVRYCPKCESRYTFEASECAACSVALTTAAPKTDPLFKPAVDIPVLALVGVYAFFFARMPGEAQTFGGIALAVGIGYLICRRAVDYYESLGRR
jgi:hypothetical protein